MSFLLTGGLSYAASAGLSCCAGATFSLASCAGRASAALSTRLCYTLLFFASSLLSWLLRDFAAAALLSRLPWAARAAAEAGGGAPAAAVLGAQAVLRLGLGGAAFWGGLAALTAGAATRADARWRHVHKGSWALKLLAWLLLSSLPFLLPAPLVSAWAWAARLLGGAFLLAQMLILLDAAYAWNEAWLARAEAAAAWYGALAAASAILGGAAVAALAISLARYRPPGAGACSLNVFACSFGLILGFFMVVGTLHPAVPHGSLLVACALFAYVAYLTASALGSEPPGYVCNGPARRREARNEGGGGGDEGDGDAAAQAGRAASMLLALCSVAWSAARAGSSSALSLDGIAGGGGDGGGGGSDDDDGGGGAGSSSTVLRAPLLIDAEDEVEGLETGAAAGAAAARAAGARPPPYSPAFFHLTFALASCYTSMLLTDWGSAAAAAGAGAGVGWASVWIKLTSAWATAGLYAWSLAAPVMFPDRNFS